MPLFGGGRSLTASEVFRQKFIGAFIISVPIFLIFLAAKYFYIKIPADKKVRFLHEYAAIALCVMLFYVVMNKEYLLWSPEEFKLLKEPDILHAYLEDIFALVKTVFFCTSLYVVIRNWIFLKMLQRKNR